MKCSTYEYNTRLTLVYRLKQDTASLDYMDSLCNPNSQTPIAALSAMLPAPIYFDQIGGKMEHTFKVLRPGLKQDLSFNLTTGDSFDKV